MLDWPPTAALILGRYPQGGTQAIPSFLDFMSAEQKAMFFLLQERANKVKQQIVECDPPPDEHAYYRNFDDDFPMTRREEELRRELTNLNLTIYHMRREAFGKLRMWLLTPMPLRDP